ncbi:MAG: hypothetical protein EZS28_003666 [Streblomastix strix]|uniref:DDE-1 domain-containing protein n=1 Tax=Streblomastix strix TaxID=222440 RepID=A0A5J4X0N2_9EUKA|nr:MAG: hypothetical protein EZS28_003666 [Streblomastix strix]
MPKQKGKPNFDFSRILSNFEPHIPTFDYNSFEEKLAKMEFKSKDKFIRQIVAFEKVKMLPVLPGVILARICQSQPAAILRARQKSGYKKVEAKSNCSLSSDQKSRVIQALSERSQSGELISPVKLGEEAQKVVGHTVGHSYHKTLLSHHPDELQQQTATKREFKRIKVKEQDMNDYSTILEQRFEGVNVYFILHLDESGYQAYSDTKDQIIIIPKSQGTAPAHILVYRGEPRFSLLAAITMALEHFIPFYVIRKLLVKEKFRQLGLEHGRNCYLVESNKSTMTAELFIEFQNSCAIPYFTKIREDFETPGQRSYILSDGCPSHTTVAIRELLAQLNIALITPPPNATHYIQVLDIGVFASYKHHFQQLRGNQYHDTIEDIVKLSASAYQMRTTEVTIENSFRKTGLEIRRDREQFTAHVNKNAFSPIIEHKRRNGKLATNVGSKITRKRRETDFGVLNCELLDD